MRLEREDSYLTTFEAAVTESRDDARGRWLALDRSAFYPTSGGQPNDTGTLEAAGEALAVVDVQLEGGTVWHLVEGGQGAAGGGPSAPAPGTSVTGWIDWERRYRHMQRHTGQHLLSQALVRVDRAYGTVSVSMRGPDCTIDFGGEADLGALRAVENEVNEAARRALAVSTFEVDDSRLGEYRLRRPAQVSGSVRLVAIGDYDLVACGGTHLANSAEALPLKIVGLERVKGGTNRLTFRAGAEALEDYSLKHDVVSTLVNSLSAPVEELTARVEQLQRDLEERGRLLAEARRAQAAALARELAADAEGGPVVAYLGGERAQLLDALIDELQRLPGTVSLLAAEAGDRAGQVRFAFLAGDGSRKDVRPALTAALGLVGGRGGGRPDRAQGAAEADEERARAALAAALAALDG